jgi:hypothetical protein
MPSLGIERQAYNRIASNFSNVVYKRAGNTSELTISKLTKNWKNRTLISRQPLYNKF